ncbi:MAG: GAF domain-containing protein [Chloroflexi bacterium]|nr:GAF domain-containing protein [Chloroflexota bacterium]
MIKKFSYRQDLSTKLTLLYLLFIVPVVAATLLMANNTQKRLEEDVRASDLALARSIAQETNFTMKSALHTIQALGEFPEVLDGKTDSMETLFSTLMSVRPDINLIYRLNAQGTMIFHYPLGPGSTVGHDFSFREYFIQALETKFPLITKGRISPTTNQAVTTIVMPLWDNEQFLGIVATNIKLETLSQTLVRISQEYDPNEGFQVFIIDSSGQIIAHSNPDLLLRQTLDYPNLTKITEPLLYGRSDTTIAMDENGVEQLYSYVPISSSGWGVVVSRPTATSFATARAFYRGALIALFVFILIGIFFWAGLRKLVFNPLGILSTYSRSIGKEEITTEIQRDSLYALAQRSDQVGHLTRSLVNMEKAIAARFNELATLLQTSAAVVSTLDSETVLNRILEQVERLLKVEMSAIIALNEKQGTYYAQTSRGLSQEYVNKIELDPSDPHSVTLRALRTGEPIQISDTETNPSYTSQRHRARMEGFRSILVLPLKTQYAPPSALLVFRPDPHKFTIQEIDLLSNFANHAAMAIENAALYTRSDMQLQEQTRRLEALIQSLHDGLILESTDGRVVYANRRISALADMPTSEIIGNKINKVLNRILQKTINPKITQEKLQVDFDNQGEHGIEISLPFEGRTHWLRLNAFNVTDNRGISIGRGQLLHDITADRELDRMKSNLISTVSHELRTPLASIKGYATTLLADDVEWDLKSQHDFLSIISDEADRLSNLVNELLDLSRIEAGNLTVNRQICELSDLVAQAALRAEPNPGNRLHINLPKDLPPLEVDERRIKVVLRNLIENAAKYTDEDTPIHITAFSEENEIIIRVRDEGPGIPEEEKQRIFESFYRVENGLARTASGAGLGLAICQGFVHAHGGKLWLESSSQGACFVISLPRISNELSR